MGEVQPHLTTYIPKPSMLNRANTQCAKYLGGRSVVTPNNYRYRALTLRPTLPSNLHSTLPTFTYSQVKSSQGQVKSRSSTQQQQKHWYSGGLQLGHGTHFSSLLSDTVGLVLVDSHYKLCSHSKPTFLAFLGPFH